MRTRTLVLALAVAALVPTSAFAQQGGGQGGMGRGGMGGQGMAGLMAARNLVEQGNVAFLAGRSEMQLTAEQSAALRVIAERWDAETKEAREQVRPLLPQPGQAGPGGMGGGDRQAMMQRFQEMAGVIQKLVEDDRKAVDEAMKHLNETQQATARRLLEERNQPRRPGA